MVKSPDAFRSIGEVSRLIGVAPHVLRYWEGQFSQLAPVKRADGRRYYRPDDVRLAAGLCQVLREEGLSIRGAKRLISADRGAGLRAIGAARLGEALPLADGSLPEVDRPLLGPAVRLAVPGEDLPEPAPMPVQAGDEGTGEMTKRQPRNAPRRESGAPSETADEAALPLFSGSDRPAPPPPHPPAAPENWLARLAGTTAALREFEDAGHPLPASARTLREQLQACRDQAVGRA